MPRTPPGSIPILSIPIESLEKSKQSISEVKLTSLIHDLTYEQEPTTSPKVRISDFSTKQRNIEEKINQIMDKINRKKNESKPKSAFTLDIDVEKLPKKERKKWVSNQQVSSP
jgi:hypothetical protein